ncbi:MAG: hypothetical protein Kow0077_05130 [Anaerolineae bacterium]
MPRYNYNCQDCGHQFEVRLSYADVDLAVPTCPACGSTACERGLSRVHMQVGNGGSDYRLSRNDLETAIGMSQAMSGGHSHSGGGCCGCSGGSCGSCGH